MIRSKISAHITYLGREDRFLAGRDKICRRLIEYGLLGLIIFSPLPAASVHEWAILVIQISALILLASYILMEEKPQINEALSRRLKWPRYLIIGLFVFFFAQIVPIPKLLIKIISPNVYKFQMQYSPEFAKTKFMSLSLIPSYTLREGLEILSYFIIGFLIIKTVTRNQQIKRIFSVLIVMGVFEAFYGLFELSSGNPRILFYQKTYQLGSVTGTFVNRNHLSGYLEMIIPLAIGLIFARANVFSFSGLRWKERLLLLSEKGLAANLLLGCSVIVMSIAIIFSESRSGIAILIFTFVLFFVLSAYHFSFREYQKKWLKYFLCVSLIIIIFISLFKGIGATIERFSLDELLIEGRPKFWGSTLRIFADFPFFGSGLGTFGSLFPDFMVDEKPIRIYHAHNDYLEYLSELGVFGFILLLSVIIILLFFIFSSWQQRRHPEVKGLALGGFVALINILIHSFTDFNLHIPANMLLFFIVLSLTLVAAYYQKSEKSK